MKHKIDIESWERKGNYEFFQDFLNPSISLTTELGCDWAKQRSKERGESFFLYYLYAALRAVNEIKEFRYRYDHDSQVVLFDTVDIVTAIRIKETGRFFSVRIPWSADFKTFHDTARTIINRGPQSDDPYEAENRSLGDDSINVVFLSATPDLYFTSMAYTQYARYGNTYPLMNAGKVIEREGRKVMPFSVCVNHSFVDGIHIADFFARIEKYLTVSNE